MQVCGEWLQSACDRHGPTQSKAPRKRGALDFFM